MKIIFLIGILYIGFSTTLSSAALMEEGEYYKQKQELIILKRELNDFYDKKEAQYQKQKKELEDMLISIKKEKDTIDKTKIENQKFLDEIHRTIVEKTINMYDKMKIKVVLDVFNTMIADGKINEVFDIMVKLKEKRVMELLKKMDVPTKTIIMEKMRTYNIEREKTNGGSK